MPRGAPAQKLAITVDHDVHAKVLRAANEENMSVSAWMTEAARRALRVRDGLAGVAAWEAEHGAFTEEEMRAAHERVSGRQRAPLGGHGDAGDRESTRGLRRRRAHRGGSE